VKAVSGKRMCRALKKHGWILVRVKGSHHAFQHSTRTETIVVPVHTNRDLKPGTQRSIMKDVGLSESDL
jgi:predicted RNA binding protein YcfA (HicA-like mRNA interferase family)